MQTMPAKRINSIDVLRGLVMVVMALDHVRDFFSNYKFDPTDLQHANTEMFFTRWVTHFCAPVFVFLSGTSAFLAMSARPGHSDGGRGRTKAQQAWQLFTRGLWLIVLEVTVVRAGWAFNLDYMLTVLQVIWAIGISMIVLSALIWLPRHIILSIGLLMIFGHDLTDHVKAEGAMGVLWQLLHVQSPIQYGNGRTLFIIYPLIPWVGVMATGFCFGALYKMEAAERKKWLWITGLGAMALFVIIRFINGYGDPAPWHTQDTPWHTVLSFLNCSKYPPSLLYLLMTLGPAITLLAVMESGSERTGSGVRNEGDGLLARIFIVYGRVPLFYYILHIYLIHALALVVPMMVAGEPMNGIFAHPGYPLWVVYAVWLLAVAVLYFPCRWFMHIKLSHRKWWLSYL